MCNRTRQMKRPEVDNVQYGTSFTVVTNLSYKILVRHNYCICLHFWDGSKTNPQTVIAQQCSANYMNVYFLTLGMEANNLKRTIFGRPSPYVKVNLRPGRMQRKACRLHHGPIGKTSYRSHTTEPSWRDEVFLQFLQYVV